MYVIENLQTKKSHNTYCFAKVAFEPEDNTDKQKNNK